MWAEEHCSRRRGSYQPPWFSPSHYFPGSSPKRLCSWFSSGFGFHRGWRGCWGSRGGKRGSGGGRLRLTTCGLCQWRPVTSYSFVHPLIVSIGQVTVARSQFEKNILHFIMSCEFCDLAPSQLLTKAALKRAMAQRHTAGSWRKPKLKTWQYGQFWSVEQPMILFDQI